MIAVEFDPAKDKINREKHGIGLLAGVTILNGQSVVQRSPVPNRWNEERWCATGLVEGRCMVCVYTMRGDVYRIMSIRAARRKERMAYEQAFPKA